MKKPMNSVLATASTLESKLHANSLANTRPAHT